LNILVLIGLGLIAGLRAAIAPAVLSHYLAGHPHDSLPSQLSFLSSQPAARVLKIAAAAELVVDKLPRIPPRTYLPALGMRMASGSLVGAAVAGGSRRRLLGGALLGSLAAAAGAYGGLALRTWARRRFSLPDTLVGAVEDAIAVGAGVGLGAQIDPSKGR
jgi:uncharacterized membrane protein